MPVFDYKAIDKQGVEKKGVIEADSLKHAREKLRDQSLIPIETSAVGLNFKNKSNDKSNLSINLGLGGDKLTIAELALITRQLATLLSSGMPIDDALLAISEQSEYEKISRIISQVRSKVVEGHSLSVAMAEYKHAFPSLYRSTIKAGEHSGHLDKVLESLADYIEKQYAFKQKIRQASIYPSLMILVSTSIVVFLLMYVVPKMVDTFKRSGQSLPFLTEALLSLSNFLQVYGLYLLALIIFSIFLFRYLIKQPDFKYKYHNFLLKLPLVSKIIKVGNTARYARTLGILIKAGVPVLDAMITSNQVVTNIVIADALMDAKQKVKEGVNISRALKETKFFPAMSTHLIASGENSGKLEEMLTRAASYQERDIESLVATFISLFEPLMIIGMGFVVLLIVLAILLPIFQMNQLIG